MSPYSYAEMISTPRVGLNTPALLPYFSPPVPDLFYAPVRIAAQD